MILPYRNKFLEAEQCLKRKVKLERVNTLGVRRHLTVWNYFFKFRSIFVPTAIAKNASLSSLMVDHKEKGFKWFIEGSVNCHENSLSIQKMDLSGREFKRTFGNISNLVSTSSHVMIDFKQLILFKFVCSQKFTDRTDFINDRTVFSHSNYVFQKSSKFQ